MRGNVEKKQKGLPSSTIQFSYDVVPSIIKDSRINKDVFNKCYKFADQFRGDLKNFDQKRCYRSELSDRLDL